jgi:hypothetical protein
MTQVNTTITTAERYVLLAVICLALLYLAGTVPLLMGWT